MSVPNYIWARFPLDQILEEEAIQPFQGFDLENAVHPLFVRENFPNANYDALLPALRLATRLLNCEASMIYYHTIFHVKTTKKHYPAGSNVEYDEYEAVYPPNRPLTVKEGFRGWPSAINYNETGYADLVELYHQTEDKDVSALLAIQYVQFARLLCHELSHAAAFYRWGDYGGEVAWADNVLTESGFDWETIVWGGILDDEHTLLQWPGITTANNYLRKCSAFKCVGQPAAADVEWDLPLGWVLQMCRTSFWEEVVPIKGRDALVAPKLIGTRYKPTTCKCSTCSSSNPFYDFKDLSLVMNGTLWPEPDSPSCEAHLANWCDAEVWAKDPLECVPDGFVLLANGRFVHEKYAKRFPEAKVMGRGWLDTRKARKSKGRWTERRLQQLEAVVESDDGRSGEDES
ncbi:hypothetical protein LTR10_014956 [Elasticomyces elasticus]|nr:hypothetical protein LTR10_014956 [Elasticomyces elasticus]KAK4964533.1 hypothetical protein LTR42_012829 [Elasticomyces elasticus]